MKKISIIIPVFNEEKTLQQTIADMDKLLNMSDFDIEMVFVNDASTDRTKEILDVLTGTTYKVIHHGINKGYGASLKTGLRHSSFEYICIIDADGTYPSGEIPRLAGLIKADTSMVVGARIGANADIPLLRRFPRWMLNRLGGFLSGSKIPDINSGLRIMKRKDVESFLNILPDGFSFTTTITLAMLTNNMEVHFTPINYYHRKKGSKIKPIQDTFNFIQLIIRTALYFNPLRFFIPLSLLLVLLAFLVLAGSWFLTDKIMDVTFGVILMTAVMVMAIGMLADLVDKRMK